MAGELIQTAKDIALYRAADPLAHAMISLEKGEATEVTVRIRRSPESCWGDYYELEFLQVPRQS